MSRTRVQLVPFDADSPDHAARMAIYPLDPDGKSRLAKHISHFPKEREPLNDTASSVRPRHRENANPHPLPPRRPHLPRRGQRCHQAPQPPHPLGQPLLDQEPLTSRNAKLGKTHEKQLTRREQMSTQEWYARRGYRLVWSEKNFYPDFDRDGRPLGRTTVFMRRDLA
ncbi:hypothetical protein CTRI78_v011290 [Colletotrichum trifolii]|uniref:Uncharacterized protein n=1 Tax=Colletotrichum trifolii TaxID=5466 RepID=A0A4R8QLM1_COLTR|nr:hypothetical protein CTRI78_v011290 [Colletotrichum trifolii]